MFFIKWVFVNYYFCNFYNKNCQHVQILLLNIENLKKAIQNCSFKHTYLIYNTINYLKI